MFIIFEMEKKKYWSWYVLVAYKDYIRWFVILGCGNIRLTIDTLNELVISAK